MATKHQAPSSQEFIDHISTESGFIDDDLFESSYLDTFNPAGNLLLNSPETYPETSFGDANIPGISGTIQIPSDLDTSKESLPSLKGDYGSRRQFFNPFSSTESLPSNPPAKLSSFSRGSSNKKVNFPQENGNSGTVKKNYGSKPVSHFLESGSSESDNTSVDNKTVKDKTKPVANVLPSPLRQQNGILNRSGPVHSDSSNSIQTPSTRDSNSSAESLCQNDKKYDTVVPMKKLQICDSQSKLTNTANGIHSKRPSKKSPPKPPVRTVSNNTNHLSKTPTKLEPSYAQANISHQQGRTSDSEYVGIGAKRKSFRIPAENFIEYHDPQTLPHPHNNIKPQSPALAKHRHETRKSDSIEKLESNEFMLSPHNELTESTFMGSYFHDSSFNPSSSSSNRDSTVSSSSSGSGSTNASNGSRPSLKKDSLHYAATNIVSLPPPSQAKGYRTSKQDTSQALQSLRKRVQIVQDESTLKLLPYTIPPDCSTRVTFPAATWDLMMQNFRIALSMENVFICDHFLGRDSAMLLHHELHMLKHSGHFDRHMQNRAGNPDYMKYATVFLTEPDNALPRIDGLVLMIYKLAHYYVGDWKQISVQISYFPNGHTEERSPRQDTVQKFLKCVYFANLPPDGNDLAPEQRGKYYVDQNGRETCIEPTFDRLVAFWGDNMAHKMEGYPLERFVINVWMAR